MAQGYKDFTAGAVLTAADLEDYCQNQGMLRFASSAARDSALSVVKTEGMCAVLLDTNTLTMYTGAAWSTIGPYHGALMTWTPTLTQSGTVTKTVTFGTYSRVGRQVFAACVLAVTGAGSSSNAITLSLPVTAAGTLGLPVGTGYLIDASTTGFWSAQAILNGTTTVSLYGTTAVGAGTSSSYLMGSGANSFTAALASGDTITVQIAYEAAADA